MQTSRTPTLPVSDAACTGVLRVMFKATGFPRLRAASNSFARMWSRRRKRDGSFSIDAGCFVYPLQHYLYAGPFCLIFMLLVFEQRKSGTQAGSFWLACASTRRQTRNSHGVVRGVYCWRRRGRLIFKPDQSTKAPKAPS